MIIVTLVRDQGSSLMIKNEELKLFQKKRQNKNTNVFRDSDEFAKLFSQISNRRMRKNREMKKARRIWRKRK